MTAKENIKKLEKELVNRGISTKKVKPKDPKAYTFAFKFTNKHYCFVFCDYINIISATYGTYSNDIGTYDMVKFKNNIEPDELLEKAFEYVNNEKNKYTPYYKKNNKYLEEWYIHNKQQNQGE